MIRQVGSSIIRTAAQWLRQREGLRDPGLPPDGEGKFLHVPWGDVLVLRRKPEDLSWGRLSEHSIIS